MSDTGPDLTMTENVALQQFLGSLDQTKRAQMAEVLRSIGYDLSRKIPLTYVQVSVKTQRPMLAADTSPQILLSQFPQGALVLFTTGVVQGLRFDAQDPNAPSPIPNQLNPLDYVEATVRRAATQDLVTDLEQDYVAMSLWCGTAGLPYVWAKVPFLGSSDRIEIRLRIVPNCGVTRVQSVQIGFGIFQAPAGVNV